MEKTLPTKKRLRALSPTSVPGAARPDEYFVRSWLLEKATASQRAYARIAGEYLEFLKPRDLRTSELSDLQGFLELKTHYSKSTQAQRRAVLKSLYSFGVRTGYLTANLGAFLKSMRMESKLSSRYLTEEEVREMIARCPRVRDQIILKLLYFSGVRVSECAGLTWEAIQARGEQGAQISVEGKGDKLRTIFIPQALSDELRSLKPAGARPYDRVFQSGYEGSQGLKTRQIVNIVKKAGIRAGIARAISPHWLRHAHASHALDRGAPIHLVQATLGHTSIATTGKYLHARPKESSGGFLSLDDPSVSETPDEA